MSEFSLARGATAPNLTGIHTCYDIGRKDELFVFTANVSAENIEALAKHFCSQLTEPCFFLIEVPTNEAEEQKIRLEEPDPLHCDVYYCDGLSKQVLFELIEKYGELLIHDGMSCFGMASHATHDELCFAKYNVAIIFTTDEQRYIKLMEEMDIPREEKIKTAWQNFTHETPGTTSAISIDGKTVYDVLEELKEYGLYFAERREQ